MASPIKVHQWKTADNSIRTSIELENIHLELLNDKIIECRDFRPRISLVHKEFNIDTRETTKAVFKYSVPEFGYYYENI